MVLTPGAAVELINRMQQVGAALAQAGVVKANPKPTNAGCADDAELENRCNTAKAGDPGKTRTCDPWFRKPMLYPAELRGPDD